MSIIAAASDPLPERALLAQAVGAAGSYLAAAREAVFARVAEAGRLNPAVLEREQRAVHGLAWVATYVEALREMAAYAERLAGDGRLGETERLILVIAFGEYLAQLVGGVAMSQGEIVRASDLHLAPEAATVLAADPAVARLIATGNTAANRAALAARMQTGMSAASVGDAGLDETLEAFRSQMRRFAAEKIEPSAHEWHLEDRYIPLGVIEEMASLGVFGLTIPEQYGGLGLGREAMCVVSEALSHAYLGVGSLGTRSEIAAELILSGGTEAQKAAWLPHIASGEILPTAVFTEPDTGSDLAHLKTRAVRDGDVYRIHGSKTWITHAARADLMMLLARTDPREPGHRGLSMFLAEKPRGSEEDPFPAPGMSGSEIGVLGYRGMKEFEIAFDGFVVRAENLLGGVEGQGFKQLMTTFETARIQTAARAVGVAQAALALALNYAAARIQFGRPLIAFPRVADKLAMMAAEIMVARQLTLFAARRKDAGRRCDLEAGMAKLLAARIAWAAADNALQIHGGNGFALECPVSRLLCDARILSIFEGAAEIQAQVIARRLLEA